MKLEYVLIIALISWAVLGGLALVGDAVAGAFEQANAGYGPSVSASEDTSGGAKLE